jgi:phosphoribosylamine--glycine ligase
MGAYSPAPVVTGELFRKILDLVIFPVANGLEREGNPYKGALYAGIMVTGRGPFVLEFNARFGDPETQAIMPRLKSDLVDVMERAIEGRLGGFGLEWDPRPCVSVVMASGGYPGNYEKGLEITGLTDAGSVKDTVIFHAGTKLGQRATDRGRFYMTSGGRVLNVTALGSDMRSAIDNCYSAVKKIRFDKMHFRMDIGAKALAVAR